MEKVESENRIYNTSFVFNREGQEVAAYRKIHMFDIVAPDGTAYKESATVKPGHDIVTYEIDGMKIGCAICYDIRFFELFLQLEKAGCDIIVLPAAFTLQTGIRLVTAKGFVRSLAVARREPCRYVLRASDRA